MKQHNDMAPQLKNILLLHPFYLLSQLLFQILFMSLLPVQKFIISPPAIPTHHPCILLPCSFCVPVPYAPPLSYRYVYQKINVRDPYPVALCKLPFLLRMYQYAIHVDMIGTSQGDQEIKKLTLEAFKDMYLQ